MSEAGELVGELRSLLHQPPGEESWASICDCLDRWEDREEMSELALPYCQRMLEGWPPKIPRAAPRRWAERAVRSVVVPPELALVDRVSFRMLNMSTQALLRLADSERLVELRILNFDSNQLGDEALAQGLAKLSLPCLEELSLRNTGCKDQALHALHGNPAFRTLRTLDLSLNNLGRPGLEALASGALSLRTLDLSQTGINAGALAALTSWSSLASLRKLNLQANRLGDEGVRALCQSPHLIALRELNLAINQIRDGGAQALAQASTMASLEKLELVGNLLTERGVQVLADSPVLQPQICARWQSNLGTV